MKKNNVLTKHVDGIVLKYCHSGDRNLVFTILTSENTKISLFASNIKHSNRKLSSPEIFDICSFEIIESEETLNKLKDYKYILSFKNLREDFKKLCISTTLIEVFNNLIKEHDKTRNIFNLLKNSLFNLNNETHELNLFKILYETLFSLLVILGFENPKNKQAASKNNLLLLLNKVIDISETNLKSLEMLKQILPQKKPQPQ